MFKLWTVFSTMGVILSRFRKNKSSIELLQDVEEEIKEIEANSANDEFRHNEIMMQLMSFSVGISVLLGALFYFNTISELKTKIITSLLSLFVFYIMKRYISYYYGKKIRDSHTRLKDLQKERNRLVDDIMEKETYKIAKDILEKYAPERLPRTAPLGINKRVEPVSRERLTLNNMSPVPVSDNKMPPKAPLSISDSRSMQCRPFFPNKKGHVERFLEYLTDDGPNTRYALICSSCSTHNGMALMEEFEYIAFKCYACHYFNPARKQRPSPPKLENNKHDVDDQRSDADSHSSSASDEPGDEKIAEIIEDTVGDSTSSVAVDKVVESVEMIR